MKFLESLLNKQRILTPELCLTVSLLHMASCDGKLEPEEVLYLSGTTGLSLSKIDEGIKFISQSIKRGESFHDFLELSNTMLNTNQKRCIVLNLLDLAYSDGNIHQKEEKLFKEFCNQYEVENEEIENYKSIIVLKNSFNKL